MVNLRDLLNLAKKVDESSQKSRPGRETSYPDWSIRIPNQTDEPMEISDIIIGRKYEMPESHEIEPGENFMLHYGKGTDSDSDYHWTDAPRIRKDDNIYLINPDGEYLGYLSTDEPVHRG